VIHPWMLRRKFLQSLGFIGNCKLCVLDRDRGRRAGRRRSDGVSMASETSEISMTKYKMIWSRLGLNVLVGRIAGRCFRGAGGGDRDRNCGDQGRQEGGEGRK
jgi:hypothetical protein